MKTLRSQNDSARILVWDGWRGIAICLVLQNHFIGFPYFSEGRLGVDIFFVLSGMLMSNILFVKRVNLKDFYVRRVSRILPAFVLFVVTMFTLAEFLDWEYTSSEFWGTITFARNYYPAVPGIWGNDVPGGHLWSLNVEEHAYVILSIFTLFMVRRALIASVLFAVGLLSIAICFYYFYTIEKPQDVDFVGTEASISFIFISAGYNLIKHRVERFVSPIMPVIAFGLAFICYFYYFPRWFNFAFAPILLAFAVNHLAISWGPFQKLLCYTPLRYMGVWSFSIYLWQQPFFDYKSAIPGPSMLLPLFLAIACGLLSFYYLENPIRNRINGYWDNRKAAKVATGTKA